MSLCEFEDDDGITSFHCARQATHLVRVTDDVAGNDPYELRYCPDHARFYLEGGAIDPLTGQGPAQRFTIAAIVAQVEDAGGGDDQRP